MPFFSPRALGVLSAALLPALAPTAAGAAVDAGTSSNWSGYAVHRAGKHFTRVSATWVQPAVSCTTGQQSSTANWVGLGGYDSSSQALEQMGTEADCSTSGKPTYYAWLELVPSVAKNIKLKVRPGDSVSASVVVSGHNVRLRMANRTRGTVYTKTLRATSVDTTSAEWIVEAPSVCDSDSANAACSTSSLADFGKSSFANASATSAGNAGSITNPRWDYTALALVPDSTGGPSGPRAASSAGASIPSAVAADGASFDVSFRDLSGQA